MIGSAEELNEIKSSVIVKPQILSGGRGKAGAISICHNLAEAKEAANKLLHMSIKGCRVSKVLVEDLVDIEQELYLSIYINRKAMMPTIMFSDKGGINIEGNTDQITSVDVNPMIGLQSYMIKQILWPYHLDQNEGLIETIKKLYHLFTDKKMMLAEINPLIITKQNEIVAIDAKIVLDDCCVDKNLIDTEQQSGEMTDFEKCMAAYGVSAVEMKGDIVVFASGAGASMAVADSLAKRGGTIRAIIDSGSSLPSDDPDPDKSDYASSALKHILDLNPKVLYMNFYYQAGRLDYECRTLKKAFGEASRRIPIVLRCKGRMAEEGKKLLEDTNIFVTESFEKACSFALEKVKETR